MKKYPSTIRDVAVEANVSPGTVSKFVNGTQRFSSEVENRLRETIDRLGYRPNVVARSVATGKTRTIGVAILDIHNPHFTGIVKGANRVALQHDYSLLFVATGESQKNERQLLEMLSRRVDGLIVSSRMPDDALEWMRQSPKPSVCFGKLPDTSVPSVGAEGYRAAYLIAQHLVGLAHKRIAFLGFPGARWNAERIRGIHDCLASHGKSLSVFDVEQPSAHGGERACSRIMLVAERPDAVICYNDLIAIGFMKEAQALGFQLPKDISVVGMDNIPFGEYVHPALTTVDMQSERMGEVAMFKMLDCLAGHTDKGFAMLQPELVLRASTMRRN
ncbi:LacI family DNA-binding transcriptional regulator [Pandoraea anhela]|uniref:LacI family transcriptional regulator n=1 Tax=Pandoraea anhela TaxID=2508295 RepID=A0A5E4WDH8_9BURK|nr:LacI family DNA-binding transcriptional regulator [Pandoraea anhela]VVE21714.1 LacI family transcriptional regulator [Pandoraea anhela]